MFYRVAEVTSRNFINPGYRSAQPGYLGKPMCMRETKFNFGFVECPQTNPRRDLNECICLFFFFTHTVWDSQSGYNGDMFFCLSTAGGKYVKSPPCSFARSIGKLSLWSLICSAIMNHRCELNALLFKAWQLWIRFTIDRWNPRRTAPPPPLPPPKYQLKRREARDSTTETRKRREKVSRAR